MTHSSIAANKDSVVAGPASGSSHLAQLPQAAQKHLVQLPHALHLVQLTHALHLVQQACPATNQTLKLLGQPACLLHEFQLP